MSLRTLPALALLLLMFLLAFFSMQETALTFDELAHIPAGYSYVAEQDYRINPEHPPLAKDLAAFPLLFLNLDFPTDSPNWQQEEGAPPWWVQFDLGTEFLYESRNNPLEIIFWSRLPMIFLLLATGFLTFVFARRYAGMPAALTALLFFALSPTFLAHGKLVTTDVAAAFGAVLSFLFWLKFLQQPSFRNVALAGAAFGVAMLMKFSLLLLIPALGLITLLYALLQEEKLKSLVSYAWKGMAAGLIGLVLLVWPVYQFHVANEPVERQVRDIQETLAAGEFTAAERAAVWMADKPLLRPFAQYALGVLMAGQRSFSGNTTYFLGELSASGRTSYFPVMYAVKIPLAFHVLTAGVLLSALWFAARKLREARGLSRFLKTHFAVVAMLLWIAIYWGFALQGNLNIGIRHLLPTLPFLYVLVSWGAASMISAIASSRLRPFALLLLFSLMGWYAASSLAVFPHYLSYYNEAGGGTERGWRIAVDSNYDWGQDFYALLAFVQAKGIETIHLDYFGGESPEYWLGSSYRELKRGERPSGWVAVSVNELMGGIARPAPDFTGAAGYYEWLKDEEPVARAGTSIFIYRFE